MKCPRTESQRKTKEKELTLKKAWHGTGVRLQGIQNTVRFELTETSGQKRPNDKKNLNGHKIRNLIKLGGNPIEEI